MSLRARELEIWETLVKTASPKSRRIGRLSHYSEYNWTAQQNISSFIFRLVSSQSSRTEKWTIVQNAAVSFSLLYSFLPIDYIFPLQITNHEQTLNCGDMEHWKHLSEHTLALQVKEQGTDSKF